MGRGTRSGIRETEMNFFHGSDFPASSPTLHRPSVPMEFAVPSLLRWRRLVAIAELLVTFCVGPTVERN